MRIDFEALEKETLANPLTSEWNIEVAPRRNPLKEEKPISFAVDYPYRVNRSISPDAIGR